jgi:type I restriction-modification system DNA methylase subunit
MALFQSSVITKHLQSQNKENIAVKWEAFKNHFHNPKVQEEIKSLKEEQYQGGFLEDFFVKILGYTKPASSSETKFNLTTEYKNVKDSKKADGAIIINDVVKAVIELKGTNTTDLGKIEVQAFGYKNNQPECTYIITSNFEKLRFYIDNAIEHIEFNLFTLTEKEFNLLYLCLAYENIEKDIPKKIKEQSISQEDAITKKLYNDYSLFKGELHQNLVLLNPQYDALELFKKSQKLLDRFLFLFFSEDRQLLPPNSVRLILDQWKTLQDLDEEIPLYNRFKKYFEYLNTGFKGKKYDVFAYNGGLFKPDEILDTIKIDDKLLFKHTLNLSQYDFDSEVDVNILGHIFENSLNELDEIKAQLAGETIDKNISKRKKDGVFYTPKYITKYIVENTVGKLCEEKKNELQIVEEEYIADKKRQKKNIKALIDKLTEYRNWLLQLTICDPACGSGAFLNQALDYLINEHKYIDELQAKLFGDAMVLSDVEKSILENNLFGVDLNEESVEIAKLSLWLRTAQPNRKLNDLNNNIKCGNSLVDDVAIAGDKAFNWQQEFPQIFAKGGFDVIIGNPPYVSNWTMSDSNREMVIWLSEKYKDDLTGHWDLFICFISISIKYLKNGGYNSFILPTSFLKEKYGRLMREKIIESQELIEIVDFGEVVIFENVARQTFIYNFKKQHNPSNKVKIKLGIDDIGNLIPQQFFKTLKNCTYKTSVTHNDILLYNKILEKSFKLGELFCVNVGVVAHSRAGSPIQFKKDDVIHNEYSNGYKKYVIGSNLNRYSLLFENQYMDYESKKEYFHRPKFNLLFDNNKIILRRTSGNNNSIIAYFDNDKYYTNDSMMHLVRWSDEILDYQKPDKRWKINITRHFDEKFILSLLCSKLTTYYFSKFLSTDTLQGAYSSIYPEDVREFPIIRINEVEQDVFIEKADLMLSLNKDLQEASQKFQRTLQRKFELETLPKKLQDWYLLMYPEFIKELAKKKIKLSLSQEAEWEDYFLQESKKALELKTQINVTDNEIDAMVYELYGLTEEEIKIVENS